MFKLFKKESKNIKQIDSTLLQIYLLYEKHKWLFMIEREFRNITKNNIDHNLIGINIDDGYYNIVIKHKVEDKFISGNKIKKINIDKTLEVLNQIKSKMVSKIEASLQGDKLLNVYELVHKLICIDDENPLANYYHMNKFDFRCTENEIEINYESTTIFCSNKIKNETESKLIDSIIKKLDKRVELCEIKRKEEKEKRNQEREKMNQMTKELINKIIEGNE